MINLKAEDGLAFRQIEVDPAGFGPATKRL
jgi:hypothetical protein